jgi:RNAse (barnase) inhibitor barstar
MSDAKIEFTPWTPPGFWNCATNAPIGHRCRALGIPGTFCVELSAHDWDDDERVFDELARAFSFPDYFGRNGNAANDCMTGVHNFRPRSMAVIRDIPASEAARANVARAAATIGTA